MNKEEEFLQKKLLKYKLVSEEELKESLKARQVLLEVGIDKDLRDILVEKGYISHEKLKEKGLQKSIRGLIEGYTLLKKLGKGGMGVVYKAFRNEDHQVFALKILSAQMARDINFIRRFLQEARHCIELAHEHIVKAYEVGLSNDRYYFTMEYIEGEDLRKKLNRQGVFREAEVLAVLYQITRALDYADSVNLVHRDIKPDNIIIDRHGVAKLCDLGLAKIDISDQPHLTQAGMVVGTPFYISPEQCRGQRVDIKSDIYSLGATLYHMATGRVPFNAPDGLSILAKHISENPIPPKTFNKELSAECNTILLKMLAKKPEQRFSPKELLAEMEKRQNWKQLSEKEFETIYGKTDLHPARELEVRPESTWFFESDQELFEDLLAEEFGSGVQQGASEEIVELDPLEEEASSQKSSPPARKSSGNTLAPPLPKSVQKKESTVEKLIFSSQTSQAKKWNRSSLLLVVFTLSGLCCVLVILLLNLLLHSSPLTKSREEAVIDYFYPQGVFWKNQQLYLESSFEKGHESIGLWQFHPPQSSEEGQKGAIVVGREMLCPILFDSSFFSLTLRFTLQKRREKANLTYSSPVEILFFGYKLELYGSEKGIQLSHEKQELQRGRVSLELDHSYELTLIKSQQTEEKAETLIRVFLDGAEVLSCRLRSPAFLEVEQHFFRIFTHPNFDFVLSEVRITGNFLKDFLDKKYQEYLEKKHLK
jgi:serine/threonine protein kinase